MSQIRYMPEVSWEFTADNGRVETVCVEEMGDQRAPYVFRKERDGAFFHISVALKADEWIDVLDGVALKLHRTNNDWHVTMQLGSQVHFRQVER